MRLLDPLVPPPGLCIIITVWISLLHLLVWSSIEDICRCVGSIVAFGCYCLVCFGMPGSFIIKTSNQNYVWQIRSDPHITWPHTYLQKLELVYFWVDRYVLDQSALAAAQMCLGLLECLEQSMSRSSNRSAFVCLPASLTRLTCRVPSVDRHLAAL